ncbi:MAG TPA: PilZ domain-containing protein [Gammaproteobacteria bacterium]|nr:PilZ domain-containing protein [Gammaproteobacteria bacterium]
MILDIPGVSDRRQSPRYEIALPVDMVLADGSALSVTTRNISSRGLQISCDSWITDKIEPRGIQNHALNHLRLKVITELPIGEESKKLYVNCRIMSVQRMSQDEYTLNLAFIDFENGTEKILDDFLDQYQQKKTVIDAIA